MINFNDVLAIIELATKNNYPIETIGDHYSIHIHNSIKENKETLYITLHESTKEIYINTRNSCGEGLIEFLTKSDITKFKTIFDNLKKYQENKLIETINNFFPKPESQQPEKMTVNDLDDENE